MNGPFVVPAGARSDAGTAPRPSTARVDPRPVHRTAGAITAPCRVAPTVDGVPRRSRVSSADLSALAPLRVARVADLVALGMRSDTIAVRVRSGQWQRPFLGIVLMQSGPPSREQEIHAAMLYSGDDAVLTGGEAVHRHGLRRGPSSGPLHVLVPEDRRRRCSPGLVVERTANLPGTVERDGITVALLDRAVCDTARRLAGHDDVLAILSDAVQQRRTTVDRLLRELDAGNQRGTALARGILAEVRDGIRSVAEGWGRNLHARSTLPPMLWNPRLLRPDRSFLACPDGYLADVGLAWEHHSTWFHPPEREDDDARRIADMVAAGVVVVTHRPRRLLTEPDHVLDELYAYYRLAASRPCPDLVVVPA